MKETRNAGIAIIGGGAAGLMAAIGAANMGASVTLFEKNDRCGRKLAITGKGRCNLTNDCTIEEFLSNVPTNPRFLYSALGRFDTSDTKNFFEDAGVPLKVERGKRVFPVSDKADDVVRALVRKAKEAGVTFRYEKVISVKSENGSIRTLESEEALYNVGAIVICTGGKSYPRTGSDGDGYAFARSLGHSVTKLRPSLVPLTSDSKICPSLQGLSLKNISLDIVRTLDGKTVYSDFGEMMFTHFGITGPTVLSVNGPNDIKRYIFERKSL